MADLTGTQQVTLTLTVQAFSTSTRAHADVFNAMWQLMLNNDATIAALLDALTNRVNQLAGNHVSVQDVAGLQDALNGKANVGHGHAMAEVAGLTDALNGKANVGHAHSIGEVAGLNEALNSRTLVGHNHAVAEITGLPAELADLKARLTALERGGSNTGSDGITADFTVTNGGTPGLVTFRATATSSEPDATITSYDWAFGDGTTASGANVTHTYSGNGPYVAALTVRNSAGSSRVVRKTVTPPAQAPQQGVITADYTTTNGAQPGLVNFSATASTTAGSITAFDWTFGDGATASGANVSHTYSGNGPYNVALTVRDSTGSSTTVNHNVTPPPQSVVTVDFTPSYPGGQGAVTFNANASSSYGGIVAYEWAFGDGATGSGNSVSHTYANPGNYNVTLLARDSTGKTASVTKSVAARPATTFQPTYGDGSAISYPVQISYLHTENEDREGGGIVRGREVDLPALVRFNPNLGGVQPTSATVTVDGESTGGGGIQVWNGNTNTQLGVLPADARNTRTFPVAYTGGVLDLRLTLNDGGFAQYGGNIYGVTLNLSY
ncbi:PKD domain containing protein (plasmid) [Deinococcus geothermalis DSM 11300]|uniref:PKD domain containing protein n=1 Tax=Deinococcus geothermalis (strain DSM 11300 / CIP 105573 / AG-3a) TaxID=319795 RepID=A8ZRF8_DEIGD|nr:PKD domain-containing protein [Deinococcus geothermalis]ABW35067.1 PKD domain containing protein [Deinococcus geothermalis DSM 11300]